MHQLQDAERNRQGTIARNNNSARSINTQRALNLATDSSMNKLKAGIYNQYAQQAMGITAQEAVQMDQNDQMRMTGEEKRAEKAKETELETEVDVEDKVEDVAVSTGLTEEKVLELIQPKLDEIYEALAKLKAENLTPSVQNFSAQTGSNKVDTNQPQSRLNNITGSTAVKVKVENK